MRLCTRKAQPGAARRVRESHRFVKVHGRCDGPHGVVSSMGGHLPGRGGLRQTDNRPFYKCKNCNASICHSEWRFLVHHSPTYVEREAQRVA
jgi:hypothetical protein